MTKIRQLLNRIYHTMARLLPGAKSVRPMLHRWRGVKLAITFLLEQMYISMICVPIKF